MPIDATAAVQGAGAAAQGRARLAESFDTFLSLLTTQLKNQDPLSPMDSTQFTQQLVQMTGVEQQLLTNDLLEKLVNNDGRGVADAVSMIGKQVRAVSAEATLAGGKAEWLYKLDRNAKDVKVEILDHLGRVVHSSSPADAGAGEHVIAWNGKDQTGAQLPDGTTYSLRVTAIDAAGADVPVTSYVQGVVSSVEQADGKTLITVSGTKVPWETVTSITQAAAPPPPGPTQTPNEDPASAA